MANPLRDITIYLLELEGMLPVARAANRLDQWVRLYTEGYMLKLRVMR
jgi:hypothetical protein